MAKLVARFANWQSITLLIALAVVFSQLSPALARDAYDEMVEHIRAHGHRNHPEELPRGPFIKRIALTIQLLELCNGKIMSAVIASLPQETRHYREIGLVFYSYISGPPLEQLKDLLKEASSDTERILLSSLIESIETFHLTTESEVKEQIRWLRERVESASPITLPSLDGESDGRPGGGSVGGGGGKTVQLPPP